MVANTDCLAYCKNISGMWSSGLQDLGAYLIPASSGVHKISEV